MNDNNNNRRTISYNKYTANSDDTIEDGEVCCAGSVDIESPHENSTSPVAKLNPIYSNSFFTKRYVSIGDAQKDYNDHDDDDDDDDTDNSSKDNTKNDLEEDESNNDMTMTINHKSNTRIINTKPDMINTGITSNVGKDNYSAKVQQEDCNLDAVISINSMKDSVVSELETITTTEIYDKYPQLSTHDLITIFRCNIDIDIDIHWVLLLY